MGIKSEAVETATAMKRATGMIEHAKQAKRGSKDRCTRCMAQSGEAPEGGKPAESLRHPTAAAPYCRSPGHRRRQGFIQPAAGACACADHRLRVPRNGVRARTVCASRAALQVDVSSANGGEHRAVPVREELGAAVAAVSAETERPPVELCGGSRLHLDQSERAHRAQTEPLVVAPLDVERRVWRLGREQRDGTVVAHAPREQRVERVDVDEAAGEVGRAVRAVAAGEALAATH
eukprot:6186949-Pleurochrysis_carterae.AAC.1